jgi:iron(III) transport system permease protein
VTLRLAWPSLLAALLLGIIRTIEAFEVPALIGIPGRTRVLTTEIFLVLSNGLRPQYGPSSAYGVLMLVVLVGLLSYYSYQTRRSDKYAVLKGKGLRSRLIPLGRWRGLGGAISLVLPVLALIPLLVIIWASLLRYYTAPGPGVVALLTTDNYTAALASKTFLRAVGNSVLTAALTATIAALLTFVVSWILVRSQIRGRRVLDLLVSLGLVFPGIIAGIAVLRTYIGSPIPIYGTVGILVAAYVLRFMPYAMRYNHAAFLQMHPELDESATVSGAGVLRRTWAITIPLALPALASAWIFVFLVSSGEFAVALLLSGPGNQVVPALLWEEWEQGSFSTMSAYSVLYVVLVLIVGLIMFRISRSAGIKVG